MACMKTLNEQQRSILRYSENWWMASSRKPFIINGSGGVGKSYLGKHIVESLKKDTIVIAPTNEALNQIQDKLGGDYIYRTVDSALGFSPKLDSKGITFTHRGIPSIWDSVEFCLLDEVGSVGKDRMTLLEKIGVPIICLGDDKQLPPVIENRNPSDPCISPAFTLGYDVKTLTIPMRNTGELWEFCNLVRSGIDEPETLGSLPTDFNISSKELSRLTSGAELDGFLSGEKKIVVWRNSCIDRLSEKIRVGLFGDKAITTPYLNQDLIIFTSPCVSSDRLHLMREGQLEKAKVSEEAIITSNTKATVLHSEKVLVTLDRDLKVGCYLITVLVNNRTRSVYSLINPEDKVAIASFYERKAWAGKTKKDRAKRFQKRHKILSHFAEIKSFYAATSHRLQGSTIKEVICMSSDILQNPCKVEARKSLYVGVSRASTKLNIYRGVF